MRSFVFGSLMLVVLAGCCSRGLSPPPAEVFDVARLADSAIDPASASRDYHSTLLAYDAKNLRVEGKGWADTETFYERLPARAKSQVSPAVRDLCAHSAGIAVRFVTDAKKIHVAWKVGGFDMKHMPWTGIRGLDLYARRNGKWEFAGSGVPRNDTSTTGTIGHYVPEMSGAPTEFMLYLPLYDRTRDLKILLPEDAFLAPAPPRPADRAKPIVFYGTSITQGGCASRTGMCHAAILGRWLDREVINLGFSGSGKMEPVMADLLAELDPCLYVLECLPNMDAEMVAERVEPTVKTLRKAHPKTPILLVENPIPFADKSLNAELRKVYQRITEQGIPEVYYLPGEKQFAGVEDCTVDGVHPTDLGFERMARVYYPVLAGILGLP